MRVLRHWLRVGLVLLVLGNTAFAQDINIAQIGPFTGLPSPDAHEINAGALAYFAKVNAAGGVNGRQLTITKFDDGFNGDNFAKQLEAVKAAKKYIALLSPIGSAGIGKALKEQLFDDAGLIIVNAVPGSDALRNPGHPYMFHVRAGDAKQLERVVMHAKVLNLQKLMVMHHDLPIGVVGLASIKAIAEKVGGMRIASVMSSQEIAAITNASNEVAKQGDLDAVVVIGSPKFSADSIAQLRAAGVRQQIYTLSYATPELITKVAGKERALGVGIVQTYPNPRSRITQIQRDFQAVMVEHAPEIKNYSPFHFEGYLCARILVQAIKTANGRTTPQALRAALREMGPLVFGDFIVDFSKSNVGGSWTDIAVITRDGSLRY